MARSIRNLLKLTRSMKMYPQLEEVHKTKLARRMRITENWPEVARIGQKHENATRIDQKHQVPKIGQKGHT